MRSGSGVSGPDVAEESGAVFEAPALVAGLDDVAMVGEPVEERCGHLGVAEDAWPLTEGQVGGDDDGGLLVKPADEVEQELPAGLGGAGERKIALSDTRPNFTACSSFRIESVVLHS